MLENKYIWRCPKGVTHLLQLSINFEALRIKPRVLTRFSYKSLGLKYHSGFFQTDSFDMKVTRY